MNQKQFAKSVLKISPATWCQVLKGQRNLGNDNADKVSAVLVTEKDMWRNPKLAEFRIMAWKNFLSGANNDRARINQQTPGPNPGEDRRTSSPITDSIGQAESK